ncbi:MAG TPA: hypothetical protein VG929_04310 [Actinomycetota bacterium]|nr:hypothetical protein [Actinomycetota bacterium]
MRNKMWMRMIAGLFAFALIGAACSSETDTRAADRDNAAAAGSTTEDDSTSATEATPTVDTPAASLLRDLTSLLDQHEYHAGLAVLTGVQAGGDLKDPTFKAAAGTLDDNSKDLAAMIGSVYGKPAEKAFLKLWRAHIGFFVDYTLGQATGNKSMVAEARKNLDGYRNDFGALIEGATEGGLTQEQVADALTPHVESTITAIDAVVAGDASAFDKLRTAAGHLPHVATALSGAIVNQFPEKF